MKTLFIFSVIFFCSCSTPINWEAEKGSITQLLNDESKYASVGDSTNWASCWLESEETSMMLTSSEGFQNYVGFTSLANLVGEIEPFDLKMQRDNFDFTFGDNVAFVSFDQEDNWGGIEGRKTKETRKLKKINGAWKIVQGSVVVISSFETSPSEPFQMVASKIPPNPQTGFTNLSGIGGMSIGYVDVPGPADFTPLFEGLPKDMCSSPHWGYVLEGAIRIIYADGK